MCFIKYVGIFNMVRLISLEPITKTLHTSMLSGVSSNGGQRQVLILRHNSVIHMHLNMIKEISI